jgi:site-specific DNA recombinase
MSTADAKSAKRQRFAIYTRYSSEMQNEMSLEAQERVCREAVAERGGVIVAVYSDGAKSGWSLEREGFIELRQAAERGKFDAVMFWKFDRLARNHEHAVMIKMLLRHEYGLKLYCVEGFSEDEDDSPYSAMMEQMLAVFSAFYSKNLSSETKRGKRQRAINGEYNGSTAPLGYDLVTKAEATEERPDGLYINLRQAVLVRRAFRLYATGTHSDVSIAHWMNRQPVIQALRAGRQPLGKEMVRDMLQNRLYTGKVPYAETFYRGTLGQGKRSSRGRKHWFEGKHQGFISDELFELCQEVRAKLTKTRRPPALVRTYILHDRVFCSRCMRRKPSSLEDKNFGKMRPAWSQRDEQGFYRCIARDRGYRRCEQPYIAAPTINEQVVTALANLTIPDGFRERVEEAVRSRVENEQALKRMAEIEEIVTRIDFSWEQGFISPEEYVAKRKQLRREIESLRPVDYDDLMEAADLLENFTTYWDECATVNQPDEARRQLLAKIVERVYVFDDRVEAIFLHGDFAIVLDSRPLDEDEVTQQLAGGKAKGASSSETCTQSGSDGDRTRDLRLDRPAC